MTTRATDSVASTTCLTGGRGPCALVPVGRFRDRSGVVGDVSVSRCRECGLAVTLPRLGDVSFLYVDRSSQDFQPRTGGVARAIKRVAFTRAARRLLRSVPATPGLVIDYACGSGLLTRCVAEQLEPGARMVAADFHPEPPADLGPVEYRSFDALAEFEGRADLVLAMHCIEHDDDPASLLARIARLARPGGYVVVEVPNVDCAWATLLGRHWDAWYVPYHRVHFGRQSLRRVAEASGLAVVGESDVSIPTMGRTFANALGVAPTLPFLLATIALQPVQRVVEVVTARPSALRLVCRRAG